MRFYLRTIHKYFCTITYNENDGDKHTESYWYPFDGTVEATDDDIRMFETFSEAINYFTDNADRDRSMNESFEKEFMKQVVLFKARQ